MANQVLWDARPSGSAIIDVGEDLSNLADDGIAKSDEVTNGTALDTHADFMLYVDDWSGQPDAGGYRTTRGATPDVDRRRQGRRVHRRRAPGGRRRR